MASYSIEFKPTLQKDFHSLPKSVFSRAWQKIQSLGDEPLPHGVTKLSGADNLYRIRVGDYRVVYALDHDRRLVTIQYVRHRKEAYRNL